jgi:hypothetical protein
VGALYNVGFTIKMAKKFAGEDYAVSKLEGLWWEDKPGTALKDPRKWNWKLMIRTPDFIRKSDLSAATKSLLAKGKPARVADVQLETIKEGKCVQVLHVGPYTEEAKTIALMHDVAADAGTARPVNITRSTSPTHGESRPSVCVRSSGSRSLL